MLPDKQLGTQLDVWPDIESDMWLYSAKCSWVENATGREALRVMADISLIPKTGRLQNLPYRHSFV